MNRIQIEYQKLDGETEEFGVVNLNRDGKKLKIFFAPNLDVYFNLDNYGDEPTFIIGKDNGLIYEAFFKLYHDIINYNIFPMNEEKIIKNSEMFLEDYHEALRDAKYLEEKRRESLKEKARYTNLIKEGVINWYSDDYGIMPNEYTNMTKYVVNEPLDEGPSFKIEKRENAFIITFDRGNIKDIYTMKNNINVRIRMSGSNYDPFNVVFMELFNNLREIALRDGEQISIDEYLILKENDLKRILLKK